MHLLVWTNTHFFFFLISCWYKELHRNSLRLGLLGGAILYFLFQCLSMTSSKHAHRTSTYRHPDWDHFIIDNVQSFFFSIIFGNKNVDCFNVEYGFSVLEFWRSRGGRGESLTLGVGPVSPLGRWQRSWGLCSLAANTPWALSELAHSGWINIKFAIVSPHWIPWVKGQLPPNWKTKQPQDSTHIRRYCSAGTMGSAALMPHLP